MTNAQQKRVNRIAELKGFRLEKAGHGKGHGRFYIIGKNSLGEQNCSLWCRTPCVKHRMLPDGTCNGFAPSGFRHVLLTACLQNYTDFRRARKGCDGRFWPVTDVQLKPGHERMNPILRGAS